ncbi:MAG: hypothetical protein QOI02_1352 [Actinomycetota bacterium]|nr:hypothetical protein [Actinomycetota bacterium]
MLAPAQVAANPARITNTNKMVTTKDTRLYARLCGFMWSEPFPVLNVTDVASNIGYWATQFSKITELERFQMTPVLRSIAHDDQIRVTNADSSIASGG